MLHSASTAGATAESHYVFSFRHKYNLCKKYFRLHISLCRTLYVFYFCCEIWFIKSRLGNNPSNRWDLHIVKLKQLFL